MTENKEKRLKMTKGEHKTSYSPPKYGFRFPITMLITFLFIITYFVVQIVIYYLSYCNVTTKIILSPREQLLWRNKTKITLERSTNEIKVFEARKSALELSDEVRSFNSNKSGYLDKGSYTYRSFYLIENSTITVDKQVNFTVNLIVFKGKSNMIKYFDPYSRSYKYETKFHWNNDTYTFQSKESNDYFVAFEPTHYTRYSVEYFTKLTTYNTSNLASKCDSRTECKLNTKKKGGHYLIFDYNVSDASSDGKITIKAKRCSPGDVMVMSFYLLLIVILLVMSAIALTYVLVHVVRAKKFNRNNLSSATTAYLNENAPTEPLLDNKYDDTSSQECKTMCEGSSMQEF